MANNVNITPGVGAVIETIDEGSGVERQVIAIGSIGRAGSETQLTAGQKTATNSIPVVIASNQSAVSVQEPSISGNTTVTPNDSGTVSAGRQFLVNCTVAGNVKVAFSDASTLTIPVAVGLTILPWAIIQVFVTGTTATATYANLL